MRGSACPFVGVDDSHPNPLADPVAAGIVLPPILAVDDVRQALRLRTSRTVHELRRREGLPLSRVGRKWLITRQTFLEWLDSRAPRGPRLLADEEVSP